MNQSEVVLTLIQFIALTLPAVGIYMQILQKSHTKIKSKIETVDESEKYVDYHLARGGLLMLIVAGIILIVELIILQPPTLIGGKIGRFIVIILTYTSLIGISLAMLFIGGSVFVRKETLDGRKSFFDAVIELKSYTIIVAKHTLKRVRD